MLIYINFVKLNAIMYTIRNNAYVHVVCLGSLELDFCVHVHEMARVYSFIIGQLDIRPKEFNYLLTSHHVLETG